MNQKGEISLLAAFSLLALMGLVLLCSLELKKSFNLLEKRTELFLCTKEAKEELNLYLKFIGRTNWAIKNIRRAALVMAFIPGFQGAAGSAEKAKDFLKQAQNIRHVSYLKTLTKLTRKSCPLDPRMYKPLFKLSRGNEDTLQLIEEKWGYIYFSKPYALTVKVDARNFEAVYPKIKYLVEEKQATLSSRFPSL